MVRFLFTLLIVYSSLFSIASGDGLSGAGGSGAEAETVELTIFFSVNGSDILKGSESYERLEAFAGTLIRKRKGRAIVFSVVGSASTFGDDRNNENLSARRANSPIPLLEALLAGVPHEFRRVYGNGSRQCPKDAARTAQYRCQNVRIAAVFQGGGEAAAKNAPQPTPVTLGDTVTNAIGMRFVLVQPGSFTMGSTENETGRFRNEMAHRVTLSRGYYLQATEVTQGQWKAVMDRNPSFFQNCGDNCPVENVSWYDVSRFIEKLNEQDADYRYRLPTEAEWEYGCRAGSDTAFSSGGLEPSNLSGNLVPARETGPLPLDSVGWYYGNSRGQTWPVSLKNPNAWGLFDMHGNVWEWCRDGKAPYPISPAVDPEGPDGPRNKIRRGGSWSEYPRFCRSAYRSELDAGRRDPHVGFRLVLVP